MCGYIGLASCTVVQVVQHCVNFHNTNEKDPI